MTKFYFSLSSQVKLATGSQSNETDDLMSTNLMSEKEAKQNNENLFDLVYSIHTKEFKDQYKADLTSDESQFVVEKSNLKPLLRPYQINAVRWMLKKEKFNFKTLMSSVEMSEKSKTMHLLKEINNIESSKLPITVAFESDKLLHPLYLKISDKMSQTIYYHKFLGV